LDGRKFFCFWKGGFWVPRSEIRIAGKKVGVFERRDWGRGMVI
jgi:hypothetical protein